MKLARGKGVSDGRRAEESRRFLVLTYVISNTKLMSAQMHHTIPTRIIPSQERMLNVRMFSVTKTRDLYQVLHVSRSGSSKCRVSMCWSVVGKLNSNNMKHLVRCTVASVTAP